MKNVFKKINIENFKNTLKEVSLRFPVAVIMIAITFILFGYVISVDNIADNIESFIFKGIISSIVVFFLSAASVILSESIKNLKDKSIFLQVLSVAFGIVFYYFFGGESFNLFSSERVVYIFLIFVGIAAFLFFAPFVEKVFNQKYVQKKYHNYFVKISFIFLMSVILGGSLTALGSIGLSAIFTLFELEGLDQGKFYAYFTNFALVVFTPLFFLSQLPKNSQITTKSNLHSFFVFLLKYIGVPFIYIYFLILYAYSIKVLLNFNEWPHGEVSWMVIGFSIFGYIIYIFSYALEKKNTFVKNFRKYFPYVVLPQIIMLFYAIYLRIDQYDFTINRYFVVVFGIWLTVVSLYLIFSKKKMLAMITMILFDFIVIISIGPWSVYNFPESRQYEILEDKLYDAEILKNLPTTPPTHSLVIPKDASDLDPQVSGKIYDLIGYLINNHGISSVENLFSELIEEIRVEDKLEFEENKIRDLSFETDEKNRKNIENREYKGLNQWLVASKLREKLKVQAYYPERNNTPEVLYFGIRSNIEDFYPIEFDDYSYITTISEANSWEIRDHKKKGIHAIVDMNMKVVSLKDGEKLLETVFVGDIYNKLLLVNKKQRESYNGVYSKDDLTFEINGKKYDYKIFFQNVSIPNPEYKKVNNDEMVNDDIKNHIIKIESKVRYLSGNGFVLVREK